MWCGGKVFIALWSEWSCKQSMKSHQFTSMISFTGSTWPTLIISLSCSTLRLLSSLSLSLSTSQTWSFTPLSPPTSSPFSHFNSPVQCALSFTVLARCLSFEPPLISFFPSLSPLWFISLCLCLLSGVCCSFFGLFVARCSTHRNPPELTEDHSLLLIGTPG